MVNTSQHVHSVEPQLSWRGMKRWMMIDHPKIRIAYIKRGLPVFSAHQLSCARVPLFLLPPFSPAPETVL
jgi:hypothetical protein